MCATRQLLAVSVLSLAAACQVAAPSTPTSPWLDGQEKSLVVVGYSTSFAWPDMLQEMLDQHAGGERVYHVLNATQGGAPVDHWVAATDDRNYIRTFGAMREDFFGDEAKLRGAAPQPTIAICQQSLQFTGNLRGPVKTESDMVGAELGADVMQEMSERLKALGLESVIIGMHIYKKPVEPEVGNERIALARLLTRGLDYIHEGPDVWTPTRDAWPEAFTEDEVHPNELGAKIMAEGWYRTLAGADAREDIIAQMHAEQYDIDKMSRDYLAWRRSSRE